MTHGLVLGKFAPFHRGHQLLVETALRECEKVTVVVYDWPSYRIPLARRAGWIRAIYPEVEVLEGVGSPQCTGETSEIKALHEGFLKGVLGDREITHFYSSEFYGDHIARSLGAVDRRVDSARLSIPISGTAIRNATFANRAFVEPVVYRDLIRKIVFMGSVSTGKSTITKALAAAYGTTCMEEYGAEYWREHCVNRRLRPEELEYIAEEHIRREEERFHDADGYCFIDTNAITTYMFSLDYHGFATERLTELAAQCKGRYDLFFLCKDDIPYEDTPDRSGDVKRHLFQRRIEEDLGRRGIDCIPLYGTLSARMRRVNEVLQSLD